MAFGNIQIIVGQVAPTLLDAAINLLSLAFDDVAIHYRVLVVESPPGPLPVPGRIHALLSGFQRFSGDRFHTFDLAGLGDGQVTFD